MKLKINLKYYNFARLNFQLLKLKRYGTSHDSGWIKHYFF